MYLPLNGPALYGPISVSTTPVALKVGLVELPDRISVTFQPINGDIYYGYDNTVSPSTGFLVVAKSITFLEASSALPIWVVAASGTVDVRLAELQ